MRREFTDQETRERVGNLNAVGIAIAEAMSKLAWVSSDDIVDQATEVAELIKGAGKFRMNHQMDLMLAERHGKVVSKDDYTVTVEDAWGWGDVTESEYHGYLIESDDDMCVFVPATHEVYIFEDDTDFDELHDMSIIHVDVAGRAEIL